MTDRELLELAAKAAGLNVGTDEGSYDDLKWWNPLTNDGDALRLAVKLGIDVSKAQLVYYDKTSNDPYAATRRAIVRTAAEIGKAIP